MARREILPKFISSGRSGVDVTVDGFDPHRISLEVDPDPAGDDLRRPKVWGSQMLPDVKEDAGTFKGSVMPLAKANPFGPLLRETRIVAFTILRVSFDLPTDTRVMTIQPLTNLPIR